jgi:CheY-like chemotaxis protein
MSSSSDARRVYTGGAILLSSSTETSQIETQNLPCEPQEAIEKMDPSADLEPLSSMPDTRILVVEDERIVGLHLKQQLVKLGYKVVAVVSSGDEALKVVKDRKPDVVLMDIHIDGDIDGIETASRIPPDHCVPVIYLTAFAGETTLQRARATKPYGYMMKPFSERELHATIQMALERCKEDQEARDRESRLLLALGLANGTRAWC